MEKDPENRTKPENPENPENEEETKDAQELNAEQLDDVTGGAHFEEWIRP